MEVIGWPIGHGLGGQGQGIVVGVMGWLCSGVRV